MRLYQIGQHTLAIDWWNHEAYLDWNPISRHIAALILKRYKDIREH
jgi:hypothetical protein